MKLRDLSLFKKMSLAFILFIMLPIALVLLLTYGQWRANLRHDVVNGQWQRIDQVKAGIGTRIEEVEGISSAIASDSQLIHLLNRRYTSDRQAFEQYQMQAMLPISQALTSNISSIWRIRMFFNNETIPEGWGAFYSAKRVEQCPWYARCMAEGMPYWMRVNGNEYFTHYDLGDTIDEECFVFVRPVKDYVGNILGVLCIEVKDAALFEPFVFAMSNEGFLAGQDFSALGGDEAAPWLADEAVRSLLAGGNRRAENRMRDGFLLYDEIEPLSVYLGAVLDMDAYDSLSGPITIYFLSMVGAVGAAMLVFYLVMNNLTRKINENLAIITSAVQGDLSLRVPVRGNDELGKIARHFNSLIELVDNLIRDRVDKETAQRDAQLNDLQYRINPHFFYNTLDILAGSMVLAGQFDIAEAVSDFGKMLRYNLRGGLIGTLAQEMQYIGRYMKIQDLRYGRKIHLEVSLPDELREREIIKFILQPIVENCILHGYQDGELRISIDIMEGEQGGLVILIRDDGKGIERERLHEINHNLLLSQEQERDRPGIGLDNIGKRIRLYYGDGADIVMHSEPGIFTQVTMTLPERGLGAGS